MKNEECGHEQKQYLIVFLYSLEFQIIQDNSPPDYVTEVGEILSEKCDTMQSYISSYIEIYRIWYFI